MSDRLSAGKGRLSRTVEVLRKVNSDSLYMYYTSGIGGTSAVAASQAEREVLTRVGHAANSSTYDRLENHSDTC
jgi:hypothetical protein